MLRSKSISIFAGVAALALMGPAAHANVVLPTYNLTVANPDLATQGSGPYASVSITGIGAAPATTFREFEVTATGLNNFVFGDSSVFNLNLSSAAGAGTLCLTNGGLCTTGAPSITLTQASAVNNVDGFGPMNFQLNDDPGFSTPHSSLTFDFTTANAVAVTALLSPNSNNTDTVAHMALSTNTACTGFAGDGNKPTGSSTNSSCTAVPAPLIGHGVVVLLAIGGVLCAGKALESFKKHRLQAA